MLLSHLDKNVLKQIARSENDCKAAIKKLEVYYGDKRKVVQDYIPEISNFWKVQDDYFKRLW